MDYCKFGAGLITLYHNPAIHHSAGDPGPSLWVYPLLTTVGLANDIYDLCGVSQTERKKEKWLSMEEDLNGTIIQC